MFVGVVFLDISKAFDTVNHDLLLSRLRDFDLDSVTCQWFQSYLLDRCQCTAIDSEHSEDLAVTSGVPQGSGLGLGLTKYKGISFWELSSPTVLVGVTTLIRYAAKHPGV